jgi:protein-S-isoprenylcysteine O-methyltransferase Ste14
MRPAVTHAGLAVAFANVALSALYLAFAFAQVGSFRVHPRASVLLIVAVETLFAVFFLLRRTASAASTSPVAWVSTTCGTFLPLLLRPSADTHDPLAAEVVQAAGLAFAVAGILSLNRSLGLLPANRGVRTTGAYRAVRHPLYAAYLVTHLGYVTSNLTAWNVAILCATVAAQLVRISSEERLLSSDPAYVAYRQRTRWRLVPFVY